MSASSVAHRAVPRERARGRWWLPAVLGLVFVYGMVIWGYQISTGLHVTDMRNVQVWGLYIAMFMLFVGLSAGGLIVASAGTIFRVERLHSLSRLAIWTSFASIVLAGLFIVPDLGHPERILNLFAHPIWHSPMVWDITVIFLYGAMSLVYLWLHSREDLARRGSRWAFGMTVSDEAHRRNERAITVFAYFALPLAIAVHSITAWIIGLQRAHADWFSTVMAPLFVASALMSGLGLLILVTLALRRTGYLRVPDSTISWLGGLLATFVAVDLFFTLSQMLTFRWARQPDQLTAAEVLLGGRYSWTFWAEVVLSVVALGMMIAPSVRRRTGMVGVASGLSILAILMVRLSLILGGFNEPLVNWAPGVALGTPPGATATGIPNASPFDTIATYNPTWVEYSISVGFLALWGLIMWAGVRWLPLREPVGEQVTLPTQHAATVPAPAPQEHR
jgi:molybdopterin-containing oxidoreductase family membrane subunit